MVVPLKIISTESKTFSLLLELTLEARIGFDFWKPNIIKKKKKKIDRIKFGGPELILTPANTYQTGSKWPFRAEWNTIGSKG